MSNFFDQVLFNHLFIYFNYVSYNAFPQGAINNTSRINVHNSGSCS